MINKIQSSFNIKASSKDDTLLIHLSNYLSGPNESFSNRLFHYLAVNELSIPPFERFTFNAHMGSNGNIDISYILNITSPVKMNEFFYYEK